MGGPSRSKNANCPVCSSIHMSHIMKQVWAGSVFFCCARRLVQDNWRLSHCLEVMLSYIFGGSLKLNCGESLGVSGAD